MEGRESVLDCIYEDDVEMLDAEDGEVVEDGLQNERPPGGDGVVGLVSHGAASGNGSVEDIDGKGNVNGSGSKKKRKRKNKKKKKSAVAPSAIDVNRFVLETCRRLKEKKSYMVYTAAGCLGVHALGDILKEVDAIQACGGQMTSDGRCQKSGGGILWGILKVREPKTYKEIMKKSREFEKQFRPQSFRQELKGSGFTSNRNGRCPANNSPDTESDDSEHMSQTIGPREQTSLESLPEQPKSEAARKPKSVHERMRLPVKYDDLFEDGLNSNSS